MPSTHHDRPQAWQPLLQRGRWFGALTPARQQALLARAHLQHLAAGSTLFRRGDADDGLHAVLAGSISIGAVDAEGRAVMLGLLDPPQWFGEIARFDQGPRTHDAEARVASTLLHLPRTALDELLAEDPLWWRELGRLLAEKVRAVFEGLEDLTALPAPARLARRLLALSHGHGMLAAGAARRSVQASQEQLGAMLSLTRQTVSKLLGDFEAAGLVARRYGAIELLDPAGLERIGRNG